MGRATLSDMHVKSLEKAYLADPAKNSLRLGHETSFSVNLTTGIQRRVYAIRHYSTEIASVSDWQVSIRNGGHNSIVTAHRLNAVLVDNHLPYRIVVRNGLHVILDAQLQKVRDLNGSATFTMVAGIWTLDYFA